MAFPVIRPVFSTGISLPEESQLLYLSPFENTLKGKPVKAESPARLPGGFAMPVAAGAFGGTAPRLPPLADAEAVSRGRCWTPTSTCPGIFPFRRFPHLSDNAAATAVSRVANWDASSVEELPGQTMNFPNLIDWK